MVGDLHRSWSISGGGFTMNMGYGWWWIYIEHGVLMVVASHGSRSMSVSGLIWIMVD